MIFLKMYGNFSMAIAYTNSYRNNNFRTVNGQNNFWNWYFVSKIVLTFYEKKIEGWDHKNNLFENWKVRKIIENPQK